MLVYLLYYNTCYDRVLYGVYGSRQLATEYLNEHANTHDFSVDEANNLCIDEVEVIMQSPSN